MFIQLYIFSFGLLEIRGHKVRRLLLHLLGLASFTLPPANDLAAKSA